MIKTQDIVVQEFDKVKHQAHEIMHDENMNDNKKEELLGKLYRDTMQNVADRLKSSGIILD